jgi:signal transduction histidine kinase
MELPDTSHRPATMHTQLSAARESERRHLARELHDELGAHLTAFRYVFARLEARLPLSDPACAAALLDTHLAYDALCEASRRVIANLHPPGIEAGLVAALAQWLAGFSDQTGLPAGLVCAADARLMRLDAAAATTLFRIAQEAVNNAAKHAHATRLDVRICADRNALKLLIADNGRGFTVGARARDGQFGIAAMRQRCREFGGALKISTKPGHGTTVSARLPWQALLGQPDPAP